MGWTCDCPDATKEHQGNPRKKRGRLPRDWSTSDAGAVGGVCKHIFAAKLAAGVKIPDVPMDLPLSDYLERKRRTTAKDPFTTWARS